jgi:hypothetical protein
MTVITAPYNITINQGSTFRVVLTWKDASDNAINLTGYSARMQGRRTVESSTTIFSLTSGSGITLGGAAGTITIELSATATAALTPSSGVYDLELVSGAGDVTRLIEGSFTVKSEVTR